MFAPLTTALILLAGISLYAVFQGLFNAYYQPRHLLHLYFALTCLFLTFYIFTRLYALHSNTAAELVSAQRWGFVAVFALFISQLGFMSEYANWRPRRILIPLICVMLALIFANLSLPYGLGYTSLPSLQHIHLPWGEIITDTRFQEKTDWWFLGVLVIMCVFAFQFIAAFRLKKNGHKKHGNALLWFSTILFSGVLLHLLNNFYIVHFAQIAEFSFSGMFIMMILYLNWDVRSTYLRAESAEGMWSAIVMNAPNFIVILDLNGNIQFTNHVLPGNKIEDIIGTHVDDYLHIDSQASLHASLKKVIRTHKTASTQLRLSAPRDIWVDAQLAPLFVSGRLAHIIVLTTDISEQIATKHKLELSEAHHLLLLNTIPYGVQEIDLSGNITYSNPAHDQLFGYASGEMLGLSIFDLFPNKEAGDKLRKRINVVLDSRPAPSTYYEQIQQNNGEIRQIKIDWCYKYDEQANVIGLISILSDITQQREAEEALRASEEKFRQLTENLDLIFYIRDLKSNQVLYLSPAYEKILGFSVTGLYNDPEYFFQFLHPEDKAWVEYTYKHADPFFDIEYRIFDKQGATHWINARRYPIKDRHGNIHRIAGIAEDITQRKKTERDLQARTQELQKSRDFTSAIVNTIGAIVIVVDCEARIVRFNHACELITDYNSDEVLGQVFWDFLISPEERPGVKAVFAKLAAGDFPNHYENYWLQKNGGKRLLSWSNTCIVDQNGDVEYVIGTAVDITVQRIAEAALRDSAEKYRTLIEHASDIILIADLEGRFIDCNSSALTLLGYTREELFKLHIQDIHPPEQRARSLTDFLTLVTSGSIIANDTALLCKNGEVVPVDINANIVDYQGSKVAVGFMRDIRERKQIEQAQQQKERRYRDMLVREVHHRIKNNLQGVIGLLRNSLNENGADNAHSEQLVGRAISQIRTIAMVHGLQAHYRAGEVRICDITRAIVEHSRSIISDDIHLEFYDHVGQPALLQEEEAIPLALVINELLTNAIKHIPATVNNKQVIVELKGSPTSGMDLVVFNSGGRLPKDLDADKRNLSGVGLDLIQALLPRRYARFTLHEDTDACGVYAKLRIEPGILKPEYPSSVAPMLDAPN